MSSAHLKKFAQIQTAEIEWRDGLPYSREFDDIYFSTDDGVAESTYVFIEGNQLEQDWLTQTRATFFVGELGFGSGLNFLITANLWRQLRAQNNDFGDKHLHYLSIEKRPFSLSDFKQACQCWPQYQHIAEQLIADYPSTTYGRHQINFSQLNITLTLFYMPVEDALDELVAESKHQQDKLKIDHWFLDGFAPAKNQSMWQDNLFSNIAYLSRSGTRLATFSVASAVKTPLKNQGFAISKRKGFGKKREMLTATFAQMSPTKSEQSEFVNLKYEKPWLNYLRDDGRQKNNPAIAIIGAGLAGCATAYQLSMQGYHCDIYEESDAIANKASGAAAGIFHPHVTNDFNISSQFSWLAYLYLLRFITHLSQQQQNSILINKGLYRYLNKNQDANSFLELIAKNRMTDWVQKQNKFKVDNGVYFPHAGAINIKVFCQLLLDLIPNEYYQLNLNTRIERLHQEKNHWVMQLSSKQIAYQHIVFCGGARSNLITKLMQNETHITRGQTALFSAKNLASQLQQNLSAQNYIVPQNNTDILTGSTFEDFIDDNLNLESQNKILSSMVSLLESLALPTSELTSVPPLAGSVGYRLHTKDRLPLVGGAVDYTKARADFNKLGQRKIARNQLGYYHLKNLWLNTAYGSHGLNHTLIASAHLTSLISGSLSPLNRQISESLDPIRFIIQDLKKSQH